MRNYHTDFQFLPSGSPFFWLVQVSSALPTPGSLSPLKIRQDNYLDFLHAQDSIRLTGLSLVQGSSMHCHST